MFKESEKYGCSNSKGWKERARMAMDIHWVCVFDVTQTFQHNFKTNEQTAL